MKNFKRVINKKAPSILTIIGISGFWMMGMMIFKTSPSVKKKIEEENTDEELNIIDKAKITLPIIWPSLAIGGISTYCLISANRVNMKRNAALTSAYYLSQNALHEYQEKVIENLGKKKAQKLRDELNQDKINKLPPGNDHNIIFTGNGDHLCMLIPFGVRFYSNIEKVRQAVLTINERMISQGEGYMTVHDLCYELNIPRDSWPTLGKDMGWTDDKALDAVFGSCLAPMEDGSTRPCLTIDFEVQTV